MAITFFGAASTPTDNSTNTANPTVVTPPANMLAGDLVVLIGQARASSGSLAMSQAGGQSWTSLTQHNVTTCRRRIFWCVFNGTWSASPSVTMGSTTCNTVLMLVFRPTTPQNTWSVDVAETDATVSAPGSPYTVTITGKTIAAAAVAIVFWNVIAANTWGTLSGAGWSKTNLTAQYRCTSGSAQSMSAAYFIGSGATGNVSQNESAGTAGASSILSFKSSAPVLTVANAAQAQTADNVTLTAHEPNYQLIIQDASQAQTVDNLALTAHAPNYQLVIQDTSQVQAADNLALTQHNVLSIANAAQLQTVDNLGLTQHNILSIADASQGQSAENISLTQHNILEIADAAQAQSADNLDLVQHNILTIADASQGQSAENLDLVQHHVLVIEDGTLEQTAENLELIQHHMLSIDDAVQLQTVDALELVGHLPGASVLDIQDVFQLQTADGMELIFHPEVTPDAEYHGMGISKGISIGMEKGLFVS